MIDERGPERISNLRPANIGSPSEVLGLKSHPAHWGIIVSFDPTVAPGAVQPPPGTVAGRHCAAGDLADQFFERLVPGTTVRSDFGKVDRHRECSGLTRLIIPVLMLPTLNCSEPGGLPTTSYFPAQK